MICPADWQIKPHPFDDPVTGIVMAIFLYGNTIMDSEHLYLTTGAAQQGVMYITGDMVDVRLVAAGKADILQEVARFGDQGHPVFFHGKFGRTPLPYFGGDRTKDPFDTEEKRVGMPVKEFQRSHYNLILNRDRNT